MNAVLGHPDRDPHGDPIPDSAVAGVSDRSPELLRYLTDRGIVIGTKLQVRSISSASAIAVRVGDESIELALDAADAIRVGPALD